MNVTRAPMRRAASARANAGRRYSARERLATPPGRSPAAHRWRARDSAKIDLSRSVMGRKVGAPVVPELVWTSQGAPAGRRLIPP